MQQVKYNLRDLCRLTNVPERTVRFYIKEGLLPPPHGPKAFSYYSYEHWLRLEMIRYFKANFLPLREIKKRLDVKSAAELESLAQSVGVATVAPQAEQEETAMPLETQTVETNEEQVVPKANRPGFDKFFGKPAKGFSSPVMSLSNVPQMSFKPVPPQNRATFFGIQPPLANRPPTFEPYPTENTEEVQNWQRIQIAPGVELHLESKVAEQNRANLAALVEEIRRRLGEG